MSTRISREVKDLLIGVYRKRLEKIEKEQVTLEKDLVENIDNAIRTSAAFKQLKEANAALIAFVNANFEDLELASCFRELNKICEESSDYHIIYLSYSQKKELIKKDTRYVDLENKRNALIKEKNMLVFKLENAPKASEDYKEAFYKLKEIIKESEE